MKLLIDQMKEIRKYPAPHPIMVNNPVLKFQKPDELASLKIPDVVLRLNAHLLRQMKINEADLPEFKDDWILFFLIMYDVTYIGEMSGHTTLSKAALAEGSFLFGYIMQVLGNGVARNEFALIREEIREAGRYVLRLFQDYPADLTDYSLFIFLRNTDEFPRGKELILLMKYTLDFNQQVLR